MSTERKTVIHVIARTPENGVEVQKMLACLRGLDGVNTVDVRDVDNDYAEALSQLPAGNAAVRRQSLWQHDLEIELLAKPASIEQGRLVVYLADTEAVNISEQPGWRFVNAPEQISFMADKVWVTTPAHPGQFLNIRSRYGVPELMHVA